MELVRQGTMGRILAACALTSFWFLPSGSIGSASFSTLDAIRLYFEFLQKAGPYTPQLPSQVNSDLGLAFLQIALITLAGLWALLSSNSSVQSTGGIVGLVVWIWSLNTGPMESRVVVQLTAGAYISMASYLGLAILPLIARISPQTVTSSVGLSRTSSQSTIQGHPSLAGAVTAVPCTKCGTLNRTGSRFCGACGAALAQVSAAKQTENAHTPQIKPRFCRQCGAPLDSGDAFCGSCGAKTSSYV